MREQGHGILSLTDGADAYGVPVSFGYDESAGIFLSLLRFDESSRKMAYLEESDRVCLTAYEVTSPKERQSVIAIGSLSRVPVSGLPHELRAGETIRENVWFPAFDIDAEEMITQLFALSIEELTGSERDCH
jgi:nitroimidazol reductase NimA-like FMN-containing flavoprotein (pyridoxamine 5'-phosphate oxidase superfamily)